MATLFRYYFSTKSPSLSVHFPHVYTRRCMPVAYNFDEGLEPSIHATLQLVVVNKTAPSECILQGDEKMKVGGC